MEKAEFKFAIIIPVYNGEKYIVEAIDSIINQDIGFKANAQLVIVDDGSTDSSGKIADSYAEKYPDNILVVHKENGGLSSARNAGVRASSAKYFSFLDSDDSYSTNMLSTVDDFLSKDKTDINIIATPIVYFGDRTGDHVLNYKFDKGTRIIDQNIEWNYPQHFVSGVFFKSDFAKKYAFKDDLTMTLSEDAREILNLLPHDPRYATVTGVQYNYRRHDESKLSISKSTKEWFFDHLNDFVEYFINKYDGEDIPKYIQCSLMYNLQWRVLLKEKNFSVLTPDEFNDWKERCLKAITSFDDDVILNQSRLKIEHKSYLLNKKYGKFPELINKNGTIGYTFDGEKIIKRVTTFKLHLNYFKVEKKTLKIYGWYAHNLFLSDEPVKPFVEIGNEKVYATLKPPIKGRKSFGELLSNKIPIEFTINLSEENNLKFFYETKLGDVPCSLLMIDSTFPKSGDALNKDITSFTKEDGKLLFTVKDNIIKIKNNE